jgi:hypothetical protein
MFGTSEGPFLLLQATSLFLFQKRESGDSSKGAGLPAVCWLSAAAQNLLVHPATYETRGRPSTLRGSCRPGREDKAGASGDLPIDPPPTTDNSPSFVTMQVKLRLSLAHSNHIM